MIGNDVDIKVVPLRAEKTSCACARPCAMPGVRSGFHLVDQTKIVTAASELARNTLRYGGGGEAHIEKVVRTAAGAA